ncbi:hypothetical protein BE08_11040 [Sorangium cellulosum]|uniref:Uncharacterized protein n=1 Tax=Sorangium cellulosum TaxID=56 RepID=A0A150PG57_SORCE|nr:hypothetical protein BE08_11040 [Sorangium cellulosum]
MTICDACTSLSPREHACWILMDAAVPAAARLAAARWLTKIDDKLPESLLQQLLSLIDTQIDDDLWSTLLEFLAREHPDSSAVWSHCLLARERFARIHPERTSNILSHLIDGGVPAEDIAVTLSPGAAGDRFIPALVWLFAYRGVPPGLAEPLRCRLEQGVTEFERSVLMFHLICLCDANVRSALGRSDAYTRYRSLYWAIHDWPYTNPENLEREIKRGIVNGAEAVAISAFSSELHRLLETWTVTEQPSTGSGIHKELDRLGKNALSRLATNHDPLTLFVAPAHQETKV